MNTFKDRLIEAQPMCIFCGGVSRSETVEHMPSRIMFSGKHRPKGLEFSSCRRCNEATRKDELIAAMLCRTFPNPRSRAEKLEMRKVIHSAINNNPGVGVELWQDQVPVLHRLGLNALKLPHWNFINIGPICQRALKRFGFKLGAALHYEATQRIVPLDGGVISLLFTNLDAFTGNYPEEFADVLAKGRTLAAGEWHVFDQFRYFSDAPADAAITAHLTVFREGFALAILVSENIRESAGPIDHWQQVGDL